ncbi:MAG: alpha/beta hydrolase [bacterium]|nr:alpha/beta hydrolase [bacterium]
MVSQKRIVLVHGWGATVQRLQPLGKALQDLGWSVLVLELPGFDLLPPKEAWGVENYKNYVLSRARRKFGDKKFFIFGHSFGGRVAIKMAVTDADKLLGTILCDTSGISRPSQFKRFIFRMLAKIGKIFLLIPPLANLWRELLYKSSRSHDYEKAQGIMKDIFKKVIAEDSRSQLGEIRLPVLILWGREDKMTPVNDAYYLRNSLPQAKLVVFREEGHRLPYNKPHDLALEIEKWMKTLS